MSIVDVINELNVGVYYTCIANKTDVLLTIINKI